MSIEQTRHEIHMQMLEKSKNAKDCGELTVVPLGYAVTLALEMLQSQQLALLSRIKEEVPEYWPNCEKYPDSMGTYCNNCRWCKNRNRDDLVTGYEWANNDLKAKLDNIAKEIRGEGHE